MTNDQTTHRCPEKPGCPSCYFEQQERWQAISDEFDNTFGSWGDFDAREFKVWIKQKLTEAYKKGKSDGVEEYAKEVEALQNLMAKKEVKIVSNPRWIIACENTAEDKGEK